MKASSPDAEPKNHNENLMTSKDYHILPPALFYLPSFEA